MMTIVLGDNGNNILGPVLPDPHHPETWLEHPETWPDQLYGLGGDDSLTGGWGEDWLYGGPGNDTYHIIFPPLFGIDYASDIDANDNVVENPGEGTDTVLLGVEGVGPWRA